MSRILGQTTAKNKSRVKSKTWSSIFKIITSKIDYIISCTPAIDPKEYEDTLVELSVKDAYDELEIIVVCQK
jgi:hypothetical protein